MQLFLPKFKSFLPLLQQKAGDWRQQTYYHYYEYPQPHRVIPHFGIRTPQFKLVRFYGEQDFWELYDLNEDPQELNNIYDIMLNTNPKLVKSLKQQLAVSTNEFKDDLAKRIMQE